MHPPRGTSPVVATGGEVLGEFVRQGHGGFTEPGLYSGPHLAGSPVIFAAAARRLGAKVRLMGSVGPDALGAALTEQARALDLAAPSVGAGPTACSLVATAESGARSFHFALAGSASSGPAAGETTSPGDIGCLRVSASSLALSASWREFFLDLARRVRSAGGEVMVDLNLRPELMGPEEHARRVSALLPLASVVTGSAEEWCASFGEDRADLAMDRSLAGGLAVAVLKRAADGVLLRGQARGAVAAFPVAVADATGAGDVWDAAFAVCRLEGMDILAAARRANAASAIAIGTVGPTRGLPSREQVEAFAAASTGTQERST